MQPTTHVQPALFVNKVPVKRPRPLLQLFLHCFGLAKATLEWQNECLGQRLNGTQSLRLSPCCHDEKNYQLRLRCFILLSTAVLITGTGPPLLLPRIPRALTADCTRHLVVLAGGNKRETTNLCEFRGHCFLLCHYSPETGQRQQTTCKSAVVRPLIPLGLLSGVQMTQRQPCLWVTF